MRISLKEWLYIGQYHPMCESCRWMCVHKLKKDKDGGGYRRKVAISLPFYLLFFIPIHLIYLFIVLWDGGLKKFEIQPRNIYSDYIYPGGSAWKKANEIFQKKELTKPIPHAII